MRGVRLSSFTNTITTIGITSQKNLPMLPVKTVCVRGAKYLSATSGKKESITDVKSPTCRKLHIITCHHLPETGEPILRKNALLASAKNKTMKAPTKSPMRRAKSVPPGRSVERYGAVFTTAKAI